MSRRGISTIGRVGLALVAALALAALFLAPTASAAAGAISGKVTRATGGGEVAGVEVCAGTEAEEVAPGCDLTAADGTYEIAGLAPGQYVVSFEAGPSDPFLVRQFYNGSSSERAASKVTIDGSGATKTGIDAALLEGGVIEGRVADEVSDAPLGEVEVCAWWEEEGGVFDNCDISAGDGSFRIVGVHAGLTEVEFWPPVGHEPTAVNAVTVSAGGSLSFDAHLARQEGRISGNVYTAANRSPLAGIAVCAIWVETGETGGCTLSNGAGAYEFFPVPPGELKIVFSPEPGEVESNPMAKSDIWPTQFWNQKPTYVAAETLAVTRTSTFAGIDGLLGPGPARSTTRSSSPPPASSGPSPVVAPAPKRLVCRKGFAKKHVKGKARCVKLHKHHRPRHHRHHPHR